MKNNWTLEEFKVRGFINQTSATLKIKMKASKEDIEKFRWILEVLQKNGVQLGYDDSVSNLISK